MNRKYKLILVCMLILSGALSFASGRIAAPSAAPDEAGHLSVICFMARNPAAYPVPYQEITGFYQKYNHLIHPAFYYAALAAPVRIFNSGIIESACGSEDYHASMRLIRILRNYSIVFTLLGLFGIYLLLAYLAQKGLLGQRVCLFTAGLILYIPAFLHIAGMVNNDVAVYFAWPYLAFFMTRFWIEKKMPDFLAGLCFAAVGILAKATFWICAAFFTAAAFLRLFQTAAWKDFKKNRLSNSVLLIVALLLAGASLLQSVYNFKHYGTIQPKYWQVYDEIGQKDSIFYVIPEKGLPHKSFAKISRNAGRYILATSTGVSQHDRSFIKPFEKTRLKILGLCTAGLLVCFFLLPRRKENLKETGSIAFFYILTPLIWTVVFLIYCYWDYYRQGMYGNSGRYFMGYLQLFLIGMMITVSATCPSTLLHKVIKGAQWIFAILLLWLFCDPFYYILSATS